MVYIGCIEYDEQLKESSGMIIFGRGSMLPKLLNKVKNLGLMEKVVAICDSNAAIQGEEIEGIPVLVSDDAMEKYKELDFVVYNRFFMEICEQLQEKDIVRIHLIRQGSL